MRILLVNASNIWGGGEYYTLSLASELKKNNHFVTIACCINSKLLEKTIQNSIDQIVLPENLSVFSNQIKAINIITEFSKYNKIDITHTNTSVDRTIGAIASKLSRTKHITSCHSLESVSHNLTHKIRNRLLTDAFIADGFSLKKLLVKRNKISPDKIHVIPNGIDPSEYQRDLELRIKSRSLLSISENDVLIGNVARLVPFKGHKYLIEAFGSLSQKYSNIRLLIAGSGELKEELTNKCREFGIENKVTFTGHAEKLNEIYSAIDIYVQPSLSEGGELFPYTVLYAMAHSIPVIVTRSGDMPYIIEDGISGYVINDKSAQEISDKLEMLLCEQSKRISFGTASYLRLIKNFTLEKMYLKTISLYENLLSDT